MFIDDVLNDEQREYWDDCVKRLEAYVKDTVTTKKKLAKLIGISVCTLNRFLEKKLIKPDTLGKIIQFLIKK